MHRLNRQYVIIYFYNSSLENDDRNEKNTSNSRKILLK